MDGVTSCGIDCISALGRARLDGHGRDCVVSSPLLPAVGWSSFSRLRPAGSRSLDACAATCHLPVGLSSCAFWCCPKASFCAFFWSWYFAEVPGRGRVLWPCTLLGRVLWPCTFAAGGILEGYFAAVRASAAWSSGAAAKRAFRAARLLLSSSSSAAASRTAPALFDTTSVAVLVHFLTPRVGNTTTQGPDHTGPTPHRALSDGLSTPTGPRPPLFDGRSTPAGSRPPYDPPLRRVESWSLTPT